MPVAPFFDRVYGAVGSHVPISREDLERRLESVSVAINCNGMECENDHLIAAMCVNIAARLYPTVAISGSGSAVADLRDLAIRINPSIQLVDKAPPTWTVSIGSTEISDEVHLSADGWVARTSPGKGKASGTTNVFSSAAAAALGCAELFRRVFLSTRSDAPFSLSLLNYDDRAGENAPIGRLQLNSVVFAGIGAVGNAAIWTLARHSRLSGSVTIIDHERVALSNLQRYVLTDMSTVGQRKIDLGSRELADSGLNIETFEGTLEQFADVHNGISPEVLVVSVDNVASRRAAQALLPRLAINGWTGDGSLGASWHIFSARAACLACLYHPRGVGPSATEQAAAALGIQPVRAAQLWVTQQPLGDEDIQAAAEALRVAPEQLDPWRGRSLGDLYTDLVCGSAPVNLAAASSPVVVPLCHQSVLAGVMMAAEVAKRLTPELSSASQPEVLVSCDNVLRPPAKHWTKPRPREEGCICGDMDYQEVYRRKWHS